MSIKKIDKISVHKICSGQVVLSLAIAVKELVENSLDAAANIIEISLKQHGSELIQVIDNGNGIEESNFDEIGMKHSTSKLEDFSDLTSVETFGFRGEALSSLCSLSDVSVTTRHVDSVVGYELKLSHGGEVVNKTNVARNIGTTVTLQNIFYTLPVRRKEFLSNTKRELTKMIQMLTSYCLIHPNVKFICYNTDKAGKKSILLSTPGSTNLKDNVANIFGSTQLNTLKEFKMIMPSAEILEEYSLSQKVDENQSPFKIEGFISTCEHGQGRSASDRQFLYINSRPCEFKKVLKIINEVYHSFNRHQYPFVLLNIALSRDTVDVNVTPDKRTIYVENERLLVATIKASLLKLYEHVPATLTQNIVSCFESQRQIPIPTIDVDDLNMTPNLNLNSKPPETDLHMTCLKRKASSDLNECQDNDNDNKSLKLNEATDEINLSTQDISPSQILLDDTQKCASNANAVTQEITPKTVTPMSKMEMLLSFRRSLSTQKLASTSTKRSILPPKQTITTFFTSQINKSPIPKHDTITNDEVMVIEDKTCKDNIETKEKVEIMNAEDPQLRKSICARFSMKEFKAKTKRNNEKREYTRRFRAKIDQSENENAEEELKRELCKEKFKDMQIIGQFNLGFVITKLESDLFIIDQHATDEKYNYEMLQRNTVLETQKLFTPQKLELTAVNESVLLENLEIFKKNGFEFTIDHDALAGHKVSLVSIPYSQNWTFGKNDIEELIFMLSENITNGNLCRPSKLNSMFASRACRKSVMIGTALTHSDMKKLVLHMGEIDQPWNCPHGRPTIRHLVNLQLIS